MYVVWHSTATVTANPKRLIIMEMSGCTSQYVCIYPHTEGPDCRLISGELRFLARCWGALRTATWSAAFPCIAADLRGPFGWCCALSRISKVKVCDAICGLVFALAGFFLGQVRILQKFGWLASAALWRNVSRAFCTLGVVAHSAPNYRAANAAAGTAHGGALGTPDDAGHFYQSHHLVIYIPYIPHGCFIYAYQGQYAVDLSYQGVCPSAWQMTNDIIAFISALS
ncbi:hypothetical protein EYC84_000441 [Monilinia fructicola]|uniref:Uncharacterized protein n=1 Tax=Monilinia fructicola TaxID=38448 RepID=A0A5M9JQW1_MONFR|nr:hypothetical protein EYC84_000441 [Monilinia fructicola]